MKKLFLLIALLLFLPGTVLAQSPPVSDAGPDHMLYLGDSVTLNGSATDPDGDPIVAWQWDIISAPTGATYYIADANTSNGLFTTDTVGSYVATLIASDGLFWSDPNGVFISVVENLPPVAVVTATPISGPAPLTVNFDGSGSTDPEGDPLYYDWVFGDGHTGTGPMPIHEYQYHGSYEAVLVVTDEQGNDDFVSILITVTDPTIAPTYTCIGFEPPLADGAVKVKKNRVLPLKAQLSAEGINLNDIDIISLPVLQVMYSSSLGEEAIDVTEESYSAGMGTDGNMFEYNYDDEVWQYNLKTKNYTAPGMYTITMISGDETEYLVETCTASFVID